MIPGKCVAAGEQLGARDVVIDLGDQVVAIVLVIHHTGDLVCSALRKEGKNSVEAGIDDSAIETHSDGPSEGDLTAGTGRGNCKQEIGPDIFALALVSSEEEGLIPKDWSPQRTTKIAVLENRLARFGVEVIPRVEPAVTEELVGRAMQLVAA